MFNRPFIIHTDSDTSFVPGTAPFSTDQLDALRKRYDSPSPSQPGPRKQLADVLEDPPTPVAAPAPVAPVVVPTPVAKADPVASAPVAPEEKVINGVIFKKVRKEKKVN
jgi:hypothetical protein